MYKDLSAFISALEREGELLRVRVPVSPVLEIAEIADRISKSRAPNLPSPSARRTDPRFSHLGGPALLFERVQGSDMPVLINALGSYRRMEMALGVVDGGFEALAARIGTLAQPQPPRSIHEAIAKARQFAPLLRIAPRLTRRALCQEVVHTGSAIDLTRLPLLRCWPLDGDLASVGYPPDVNVSVPGTGHPEITRDDWERTFRGRYITLAGIHTIHADDRGDPRPRSHNVGMYRVQLFGKRTMAMHWHMHHDGAAHWRSWKRLGKPMPVAIALGGESVLPYAATCPLPPGISELLMAGFLNGRGIELARCKTVPLRVPANAEIVIEGFVSHSSGTIGFDPRDPSSPSLGTGAVFEGPFGDHTGFYSLPDRYPILNVTAITHRKRPIYPTTIVGLPPQEDYFMGKATERIFLPLLKVLIPDIEDYDLPMFGAFHNCAFVRIRKSYPLHARRVMHAIWGAGQMAWTKMIVVVDDDADVHDHPAILRRIAERCHPLRDIERVRGPLDILDHAAPRLGAGTKVGFDATRRLNDEGTTAIPAREIAWTIPDAHTRERVLARVRALDGVCACASPESTAGWMFISCSARGRDVAQRLVALQDSAPHDPLPPYVVLLAPSVDPADTDDAMFHLCAAWDPGRDSIASRTCLIFDATPKVPDPTGADHAGEPVRDWPPIIAMDDATRQLVDRRWKEYGLA